MREDRIHNEAIVDARPEEQAMSWYYYLESKIRFPFRARCVAANAVSPLRKGETTEALRMATEDACEHDMLVQIHWQARKMTSRSLWWKSHAAQKSVVARIRANVVKCWIYLYSQHVAMQCVGFV